MLSFCINWTKALFCTKYYMIKIIKFDYTVAKCKRRCNREFGTLSCKNKFNYVLRLFLSRTTGELAVSQTFIGHPDMFLRYCYILDMRLIFVWNLMLDSRETELRLSTSGMKVAEGLFYLLGTMVLDDYTIISSYFWIALSIELSF